MLTFEEARLARRKAIEALDKPQFREFDVGVGIALPDSFDDGNGDYQLALRVSDHSAEQVVALAVAEALHDDTNIEVQTTAQPTLIPPSRRDATLGAPASPLAIGSAIHRQGRPAGTLSFFARINNDVGFVSCNHVLTDPSHFTIGEQIFAPGHANFVGTLRHVAALRGNGRKAADCAFARIDEGALPANPGLLPDGTTISRSPARVRRGLPVIAFGRTSERSEGKITACRMWRRIPYPPGFTVLFRDVFEIQSTLKDPNLNEIMAFSDPG
ncbi:MAG TPA: hypothetical protein VN181_05545, partial [Thermoanaerobaculia bacterium]|nr:hypothetical protein [Thermoanaerobaculia bacterium]